MFDALAARAVAAELNERIGGGRVQAVFSLDDLTVGYEVYAQHARSYLLASSDATTCRIHLVSDKLRTSGDPVTPFLLLLKKFTDGALVKRVEAVSRERILRIEFDQAEYGVTTLVAEIMGRLSNLILLDASGTVFDAIRRVTPRMSRARTVQPRSIYLPPPPQEKADPLALSSEQLGHILEQRGSEPLWQVLVQSVAGMSPLLARELAFRASGHADAKSNGELAPPVHAELTAVWHSPAEPTLAYEADEPLAVAAFALNHLDQTERMASMSAALEKYFGVVESYEPAKEPLRRLIEASRTRLERKRAALRREMVSTAQVERLRVTGELILAHSSEIETGQKSLSAEMVEGQPLHIKLDSRLTPVENAQKYFAEYRRAKDAVAAVPVRLVETEADIEFADQMLEDLETAKNRAEIEAVIAEARDAGLITKQRREASAKAASQPRKYVSPDGFQVLVGRNARENEEVTFHRASANDLWLHARGVPGAHVVIVTNGRQVPSSTLDYASSLAAFHSKARGEGWVDVTIAPRKNVGRVSGRAARPGLVTVRGERILRTRPLDPSDSDGDSL